MLDVCIRGGLVIDGTGVPGRHVDVGVQGDRIVAVGPLPPDAAAHEVDATGHVVAPGFIDVHSHSDYTLLLNRRAESAVRQGVTTELVGNCGMGCAPLTDPQHLPLVALEYLEAGGPAWGGFGEWLAVLQQGGLSINVAALVGHGAIRLAAMGTASRPATPAEVGRMVTLVEQSLDDGAYGFSSGLEYNPGKNAEGSELVALAAAAGRRDGIYATHIRNRDYHYLAAVEEAISTAAQAGVPLQLSHVSPRWGAADGAAEKALHSIEAAHASGIDIWFDNHPYVFGRGLVMSALPPAAFEGGTLALKERLQDPQQRRAMRQYPNPQWKHWREGRWDLLTVYDAPHSRELEMRSLAEIAESTGRDPWDVVCDLLLAEWENPSRLYWSAPIHKQADVDETFRHPRCLVMSDGSVVATYGPYRDTKHIYAYGWAANLLRAYVRERQVLSLEAAVHKISGLPAQRLGLHNRGVLGPGKQADIVIFHPGEVTDHATFDRPIAYAGGVRDVWVNGVQTIAASEHTGALAGQVLRHSSRS